MRAEGAEGRGETGVFAMLSAGQKMESENDTRRSENTR